MRFLVLVLIAILAVSTAARADWQNTKWGMSENQVRSTVKQTQPASDADIKAAGKTDVLPRLKAPYYTGPYEFSALFRFDPGGRLQVVELQLTNRERCVDLLGDLRGRYGKPATEDFTSVSTFYRWITARDVVQVLRIGLANELPSSCSIRYEARDRASNRGL